VLDAVTVLGRYELPPRKDTNYVGFLEAAGGSRSVSMTVAICHLEGEPPSERPLIAAPVFQPSFCRWC
jgi:hypothetical protein